MANINLITVPDTLINHKIATKDLFSLFGRQSSFNKTNVNMFFLQFEMYFRILEI